MISSLGQPQILNDSDLAGPWPHDTINDIHPSIARRGVAHSGPSTDSTGDHPSICSTASAPPTQDTKLPPNSRTAENSDTTEPAKVVDVIERVVKDGNGKMGKYTGTCRIEKNTLTGQRVCVPTGLGRMKYVNNIVYDGEWEDGLWHGHGTFTPASDCETYKGEWMKGKRNGLGDQLDSEGNQYIGEWTDDVRAGDGSFTHHSGWTVEGQWEKDRCIKCSSIRGLTDVNYVSAYEWAQEQDAEAIIPPLGEAIGRLGVNFPRFLEGKKRQAALHVASKEGNMNEVKRLLEDGAEVDKEDKHGFTALDVAILHGHLDLARELCKKMNIETWRLDGSASSLHWAAGLGRLNVVKELIGKGGDIEVKGGEDGKTPLHEASENGRLDVAKFLVENKADVNAKNNDGETPLHKASCYGHLDVVKFLVENKADVNAKKNNGWTPLDIAKWRKRTSVVDYLRSKGGI